MQQFLCWVCDLVGVVIGSLPSTPPEYTISGLILATGKALPIVGTGLISEVYSMVQGIVAVFLVIKAFSVFQKFKVW